MAKVHTGKTPIATPFGHGQFKVGGGFKPHKSKDKGLKGLHRGLSVKGGKKSFGAQHVKKSGGKAR